MAKYIMTAAEIADMKRDYVDNADENWRIAPRPERAEDLVEVDRDYLADIVNKAEDFAYDDSAYAGPDMCIFCGCEVFDTYCGICQEYKGVVSWFDFQN